MTATPGERLTELRRVLRALRFSDVRPGYVRGASVAVAVTIHDQVSGSETDDLFDAHLSVLPLEGGWSWIEGRWIAIFGQGSDGTRVYRVGHTGVEGGISFPRLVSGQYRALEVDDLHDATLDEIWELLDSIRSVPESRRTVSGSLVAVHAEQVSEGGRPVIAVTVEPYSPTVYVDGVPVLARVGNAAVSQLPIITDGRLIVDPGDDRRGELRFSRVPAWPRHDGASETADQRADTVVEEAARLFRQMRFAPGCGAYAEGQLAAALVEPRWSDDRRTLDVRVACRALGRHPVTWAERLVFVERQADDHDVWVNFFDARGETSFALAPDAYRLSVPVTFGRTREPIALAHHEAILAPSPLPSENRLSSVDGRVTAVVRQRPGGSTLVTFLTDDDALKSATVRFAFLHHESGTVLKSASATFAAAPGKEAAWEATWEERFDVEARCDLVFDVSPVLG